ncbi:MAG: hypothetical protein ACK42Z_02210 [Candidatus Kapaibacteriota bacterium]
MKSIISKVSLVVLLISSCQVNDADNTAKLITLQELLNLLPGYEWFLYEYYKYQPEEVALRIIDSLWNLKKHKFMVFSNPSCNCAGTQAIFPMIVKCLKSGNIPDSSIIIYSMLNETYQHPFTKKFRIKKLPACFIEIDTTQFYSVVDTFELYRYKFPGKYKIEHIISLGLSR